MRRCLVLLALLASPALAARTSAPRSAQALTAASTAVVHGTVTAAETRRVRHEVRTTYTIAPIRSQSGSRSAPVVMELPGGRIGDARVEATGVPVWSVGDEVVVFLDGDRPTSFDGLLTVADGLVSDPQHRPTIAMPTSLTALAETVAATEPPAPR